MSPVAAVYTEPANVVITPAPLVARVMASPPADVIIVTACPPTAVASSINIQCGNDRYHICLQVTSVKTEPPNEVTSENTDAAMHKVSVHPFDRDSVKVDIPPCVASENTEGAERRCKRHGALETGYNVYTHHLKLHRKTLMLLLGWHLRRQSRRQQ